MVQAERWLSAGKASGDVAKVARDERERVDDLGDAKGDDAHVAVDDEVEGDDAAHHEGRRLDEDAHADQELVLRQRVDRFKHALEHRRDGVQDHRGAEARHLVKFLCRQRTGQRQCAREPRSKH